MVNAAMNTAISVHDGHASYLDNVRGALPWQEALAPKLDAENSVNFQSHVLESIHGEISAYDTQQHHLYVPSAYHITKITYLGRRNSIPIVAADIEHTDGQYHPDSVQMRLYMGLRFDAETGEHVVAAPALYWAHSFDVDGSGRGIPAHATKGVMIKIADNVLHLDKTWQPIPNHGDIEIDDCHTSAFDQLDEYHIRDFDRVDSILLAGADWHTLDH